ncbi:MAG TPA: hydrogenase maturation nickel metallochaperone HypA [Bacteroidales bacterium]|nr:hydrogenase maturation nickel metallochaperone HypA [Bacteroidales bacterium]
MHEMSIAQNIIDIAASEAKKAGVRNVLELELEIGKLAGVEYESLEFALGILAPGSVIDGCNLVIHKPDGQAVCCDCGFRFFTDSHISTCPECNSYYCSVDCGKELKVKSILVD